MREMEVKNHRTQTLHTHWTHTLATLHWPLNSQIIFKTRGSPNGSPPCINDKVQPFRCCTLCPNQLHCCLKKDLALVTSPAMALAMAMAMENSMAMAMSLSMRMSLAMAKGLNIHQSDVLHCDKNQRKHRMQSSPYDTWYIASLYFFEIWLKHTIRYSVHNSAMSI